MDKLTIETYDKLAIEYDLETADFWDKFPHSFFDKFIDLSGNKILDVGSGPGRDGLILNKKGKEVICLDASKSMVEASRSKGLNSVLADFNSIPFPDEYFDGVWSYTSLLHSPKAKISEPLLEIVRVLKPKGVFGLGLIEGEGETYKETTGVKLPRWFSFYKKEEVEKLLINFGFEIIYFEDFQPNSKKYLNFISRKK